MISLKYEARLQLLRDILVPLERTALSYVGFNALRQRVGTGWFLITDEPGLAAYRAPLTSLAVPRSRHASPEYSGPGWDDLATSVLPEQADLTVGLG